MMAEIRANREYKFKEFCISEEIPKSPPIKTKRWTFHDTNPNCRLYNHSAAQRKVEEKGSSECNWLNQQFVKPFKKPESDLRAEFFNAYKKYYRRVDIKRFQVESTLNVDAKFKGADKSAEGESSLYKEKECMEINIVMDTEKDDALVSSKVRRTVLSVSPGEDGSCGKENIKSDMVAKRVAEEMALNGLSGQNVVLGEAIQGESKDCSTNERSNWLASDLPITSQQKYFISEEHANMESRQKQEQSSINRTLLPFPEMSPNSNNIESKSGKNLLSSSGNVSMLSHEGHIGSCEDPSEKRKLLVADPRTSEYSPIALSVGGKYSTTNDTVVGELIHKNEYVKRAENRTYKSKIEPNINDPVYPNPFEFRDTEEKSRPEMFHDRKNNFKKSMHYINSEDVSVKGDRNYAHENSRRNPIVDRSQVLENAEENFNIDCNSKYVGQHEPKYDTDRILSVRKPLKNYHAKESLSEGFNLEERDTFQVSIRPTDKNAHNTISILRSDSPRGLSPTKSLDDNNNCVALTLEENISNSKHGIKLRGLRGAQRIMESNKKLLKSLVVNVFSNGDLNFDGGLTNGYYNTSQKRQTDLKQRHEKQVVSNLDTSGVYYTCSRKPLITYSYMKPDLITSSELSHGDTPNLCNKKLRVPGTFQVTKTSSNSKKICPEESSFVYERRGDVEEPFVIWTNTNSSNHTESLQINTLTVSDNDSNIGSEYDTNSNIKSSSDCNGVCEISEIGQKQLNKKIRDYQNHSLNSDKRDENAYFHYVSGTSNEKERKGVQFFEVRNNCDPKKNCVGPKFRCRGEFTRCLGGKCAKEVSESEMYPYRKDDLSLNEKEEWGDDTFSILSRRHLNEESSDRKQRSVQNIMSNVCISGKSQWTEWAPQPPRTCDKNTNTIQSNRNKNDWEKYGGGETISQKLSNEYVLEGANINCDNSKGYEKKISKPSISEFLQVGPTYSVHYSPANKKVLRRGQKKNDETLGRKETDKRCHGEPVNGYHRRHGSTSGFIHKKRNETQSRNCFQHSPPIYCDNCLKPCCDEIIYNSYNNSNNDINSCGYHNTGNITCCDCESHVQSHRMMNNNNICPCHVRDTNLYCHSRNSYNCPKRNKHCVRITRPNKNRCRRCGDEEMNFLSNECSTNFQNPNPVCSSTRKVIYCGVRTSDDQVDICPPRVDDERQWMSTGHQPLRNTYTYKCTVDDLTSNEQSDDSSSYISPTNDVKEPFMKESESHRTLNSLCNGNSLITQECYSTDNHNINDSYSYDKKFENVCQLKYREKESAKNNSMMVTEAKSKCHLHLDPQFNKGVGFNIPDIVDNPLTPEYTGPVAKVTQEKRVGWVMEREKFSNKGKQLRITDPLESYDRKMDGFEVPDEPSFLCEEQWDSDDGLPIRRVIRKVEEIKQERGDISGPEYEPIYLREEHWGVDDEETGTDNIFNRDYGSTSGGHTNNFNCLWKGKERNYTDSHPVRRDSNLSDGEDARKCSSVHAVSDPSFHCEQQWASDEEKCEDHKVQSTLPKNRTKKRKGRDRRSFNPRRWDMVTDLPKNECITNQNRLQSDFEGDDYGDTVVFQNNKYYSSNE